MKRPLLLACLSLDFTILFPRGVKVRWATSDRGIGPPQKIERHESGGRDPGRRAAVK